MSVGIEVRNLRVEFDRFVALEDTSFRVDPGESFGIVGESGSGKSTVLRAICGLAPIVAGTVQLVGGGTLPGPGTKAFRRRVQMVFQDPYASLHPRQTVDRILAEPLAIHAIEDAETRIERALDEVGLGTGFRFRYPHQLSGGQRQRIAVARALILEPQILLLDEPTSSLDASVQAEVLNLLEELRARRGLTFIMVSHDLAVVTHLCERLMVMQRGRTVEALSAADLAASRVTDAYTRKLMEASTGFHRGALGSDTNGALSGQDRPLSPSRRPTVAVVIPAYNEQGAVRATVEDVRRALEGAGVSHEIIVVNDGSGDNTVAEAQASGARVVSFTDNVGYGHALKAGIGASDSDLVAILDADGTYPPEALPAMIQMAAFSDMVVGDRGPSMKNVPLVRRPAKWILKGLASLLARHKINDVNSGLRVFRRPALERFVPLLPDGYSFTTTITLCMLASNLTVVYYPIHYGQRIGRSKIKARHFFKFVFLVVRLTVLFQPLRIFLPLGAILFVAGAAKAIIDFSAMKQSTGTIVAILAAVIIWSLGFWANAAARLRHTRCEPPGEKNPARP
jgi:peptide/nickel transport system ATP-binding protein